MSIHQPLELDSDLEFTTISQNPASSTKSNKKTGTVELVHSGLFSGSDITVYAALPSKVADGEFFFKQITEIETLSYSVYRYKRSVYGLGNSAPRGFTRGSLTVAGTIVFTVGYERILNDLLLYYESHNDSSASANKYFRIDQLPPINLYVELHNEYGNASRLGILGVEFMNEGQVMSVADLIIENSVNYMARDIIPLESYKGSTKSVGIKPGQEPIPTRKSFNQLLDEAVQEISKRRALWL